MLGILFTFKQLKRFSERQSDEDSKKGNSKKLFQGKVHNIT